MAKTLVDDTYTFLFAFSFKDSKKHFFQLNWNALICVYPDISHLIIRHEEKSYTVDLFKLNRTEFLSSQIIKQEYLYKFFEG